MSGPPAEDNFVVVVAGESLLCFNTTSFSRDGEVRVKVVRIIGLAS